MKQFWQWFSKLANNPRRCLQHFAVSATVFFTAYGTIYWANDTLPPSLEQELYSALAVTAMICAFAWAIIMQICQIVIRIKK